LKIAAFVSPGSSRTAYADVSDADQAIAAESNVHFMCAAGSALAVMGNHEFNALGWAVSYQRR